ncbi:pickpocket protein 28-like [Musca vetustissima]|uniref:pickpocket protein 28-like n=1 Tax=Musca vetustissima TaxID=27455 RepID=UPI002AB6893B|nr:pickpocket protein 28-like [Musca vetustissima]
MSTLNRPKLNVPLRTSLDKPLLMKRESSVNLKQVFSENTEEFCTHSTLHGLKYVVDEQLYPGERIFFALSFVAVVLLSIFFIRDVYAKWRSTPVIVGISPQPSFIVNEPFPAVTFCNLNQASKKRAEVYNEFSSEYAMLQLLCKKEVNQTIASAINWNLFEDFIVNISQPCEEMIIGCNFGGLDYNCKDIFRTIVTDEGLCCVFNQLDPKYMYKENVPRKRELPYTDDAVAVNWNPEKGYPDNLPDKFYPRTAAGTGQTLGLSITFDVDINDYYCSSTSSVGIKMALHSPAEVPHVREIGTLLPAGYETKIRIRPDKTEAALNLKSINRKYRQCLFDGEEHLTYFSYYNGRNCEMECQARRLLERCNCLAYYMPLIENNTKICGIIDTPCVKQVAQHNRNRSRAVLEDCQHLCWPSCFDLNFYSDFFSAPISHEGFEISNKLVKNMASDYAEKSMGVAHFYFTDNTFRSTKQTEFVGITDFLSSVGGLMGLFMGFSFISIAEFIYYAILRPYHKIKKHDRLNQSKSKSKPPQDVRDYQVRFVSPTERTIMRIPDHLTKSKKLQMFPHPNFIMGRRQSPELDNDIFNKRPSWNSNRGYNKSK